MNNETQCTDHSDGSQGYNFLEDADQVNIRSR